MLAAAALPAAGQMYKCKNERGATQYSDKPCPQGHQGGEVEIRGQPPISGKLAPAKEDLGREEREFQRRQMLRNRQDEQQARQLALAKQRCDSMRAQLQRLNATRRPRNADAHEAQVKRLSEEISQKCR
ncbi:MAG TPA: DUF4124 domain-containing protein [Burkholderiales bacterium]|nr:DUF4124 domain-containing protein [Burkholderiales bacterium]